MSSNNFLFLFLVTPSLVVAISALDGVNPNILKKRQAHGQLVSFSSFEIDLVIYEFLCKSSQKNIRSGSCSVKWNIAGHFTGCLPENLPKSCQYVLSIRITICPYVSSFSVCFPKADQTQEHITNQDRTVTYVIQEVQIIVLQPSVWFSQFFKNSQRNSYKAFSLIMKSKIWMFPVIHVFPWFIRLGG